MLEILENSKGSRKKSIFFSGPATKRGGGRAGQLRKTNLFFSSKKNNVASNLEGGHYKDNFFWGFQKRVCTRHCL